MKNTRMLTEGALMLGIFVVLLFVSMYVPLVMIVTQLFLILPFLLYSAKYPLKNAAILLVGAMLIAFIIGSIVAVPFAFINATIGIVMGYGIRTGKSKAIIYLSSSMAFLFNIVLFYMIATIFLSVNFIEELGQLFKTSMDQYTQALESFGQAPPAKMHEQMNEMIQLMGTMAPTLLIILSFSTVLLLVIINFPIAKRLGVNVPKFGTFRELKLPKSVLWYYLVALVLTLLVQPESGTYMYMVLVNGAFILQALLVIQGLAFIYFYSHLKKWPLVFPILAVILTLFFPIFLSIVRMLGIIDIGFNLRTYLDKK
ncbi:YybS family protein [Bacillus sp. FSL K6-3431]|uniref:YybS family protein n=1 Tax=Bacillus sp. FSL K6-3431 TaxID=2921500 RepID=UPI0030F9B3B2